MTAIATPFVQGSPEWLEARLEGIGSSDAPIIAGERGSIVELWAIKTRQVEPEPPGEDLARLFEWGHRLEPVIADWYSDSTGRPLRRVNRMLVSPTVPYAFASLDRVSAVKGERRIVEIKTDRWGWTKDEPIPGTVMAQVQHQMWVTGYDVVDVAVLSGGSEPRVIEVPRDPEYIDNLAWLEATFWQQVQARTAPPADGSETTRRVLTKLHPRDDGTMLGQTPELVDLVEQLRTARAAEKEAKAYEGTISNAIRTILGDASGIAGLLTMKRTADSVRTNWPAIAGAYRRILDDISWNRELLEQIVALHTEASEGYRPIRLLKGE